jgi:hypothetical protein
VEIKVRTIKLLLFGALLLLSFGCFTVPPTAEKIANADYGTPILQDEAETKAVEYLHSRLNDPMTYLDATHEWNPIYKSWLTEAPLYGGNHRFGYRLDGKVNVKSSITGSIAFQKYWFVFYNGEIISVYGEAPSGFGHDIMKKQF